MGSADIILDLVSTGVTLRENNLKQVGPGMGQRTRPPRGAARLSKVPPGCAAPALPGLHPPASSPAPALLHRPVSWTSLPCTALQPWHRQPNVPCLASAPPPPPADRGRHHHAQRGGADCQPPRAAGAPGGCWEREGGRGRARGGVRAAAATRRRPCACQASLLPLVCRLASWYSAPLMTTPNTQPAPPATPHPPPSTPHPPYSPRRACWRCATS